MKGPPSADVTVAIAVIANTPSGLGETDVTMSPSTLTFTTSNWSTPRTVTPKVTKDSDTTTETVTLSHTVTSTDSGYSSLNLPDGTMEVKDVVKGYDPGLAVSDAVPADRRIGDDGIAAHRCGRASRRAGIRGSRCPEPGGVPSGNCGRALRHGGR